MSVFVLAGQGKALASVVGGLSPLPHQELRALNSPRTDMPFLYQADLMSSGEKRCLILGEDTQVVHLILRLAQTDRLLLPANNSL